MEVKSFTPPPWKEPSKVSDALQAGQILVGRGSESKMSDLWDIARSRTPSVVDWVIFLLFIDRSF